MAKGQPGRTHGTASSYRDGCHCDLCRAAFNAYHMAWRRARGIRPASETQAPQHGTRSRYRKGCRDECCKAAERDYRRRHRQAQARAKRAGG